VIFAAGGRHAKREAADMQKIVDQENAVSGCGLGLGFLFRKSSQGALRLRRIGAAGLYYELNHVILDGVFFAAGKLYTDSLQRRHICRCISRTSAYSKSMIATASRSHCFLGDYYARPSKRGGAWMNAYVQQSGLFATKPVVANPSQHSEPPPGEPTLLTHDDSADCVSRIRSRASTECFRT